MVPELSIVIVTYNSADYISACLASIQRQSSIVPLEVIIVDNASKDTTQSIVKDFLSQKVSGKYIFNWWRKKIGKPEFEYGKD
jgi:glycosyltransferase involved in cell wall biosynthesis